MSFFADQKLRESLSEPIDIEVALDAPRVTNGNLPALFGNNQGDGVGFLRKTEPGTMPQPDRPIQIVALRQGKDASGCYNPIAAQNHPTVMKDGLGMEDGQHKFLGEFGIQFHAAFRDGLQANIPLEGYECPESLAGEVKHRVGDFLDLLAPLEGRGEEAVATELVECSAEFGLKDHDEGNGQEDRETTQ